MKSRAWKPFLLMHAGLVLVALLFPLYRAVAGRITRILSGCLLHDYLFLYCPLCGGTRALGALLQLDLLAALHYNAFVVLLTVVFLIWDVAVLIRILRGSENAWSLPRPVWITLCVLFVAFGILRNWLMIAHHYDPVGDLGAFWFR